MDPGKSTVQKMTDLLPAFYLVKKKKKKKKKEKMFIVAVVSLAITRRMVTRRQTLIIAINIPRFSRPTPVYLQQICHKSNGIFDGFPGAIKPPKMLGKDLHPARDLQAFHERVQRT